MNAIESAMKKNFKPQIGDFYSEKMDEIIEAVERVVHPVVKTVPDEKLVGVLHELVQTTQDKIKFEDAIQCNRQECSFCCHSEIFITPMEAAYIKQNATYEIDQERLAKQRAATDYNQLSFADKACIMLKNGKCQIYKNRPILCRNHAAFLKDTTELFKTGRILSRENPGKREKWALFGFVPCSQHAKFIEKHGWALMADKINENRKSIYPFPLDDQTLKDVFMRSLRSMPGYQELEKQNATLHTASKDKNTACVCEDCKSEEKSKPAVNAPNP